MHLEFVLSVIIMYWYIIKQDLKKKIEKSHFKLGGWPGQNPGRKGGTQTKPNCQNLTVFYIYLGPITRLRAGDFFNESVWSVRSFWIQKTYILSQFFLGPPLCDPDFALVTPQA